MQVGAERRQIGAAALDRLHDAHAIDDAKRRRRPQIVGHGLGDAGRQPGQLPVAADVGEIEDGNRRLLRECFWRRRHRRPLQSPVRSTRPHGAVVVTGAMNR